MGRDSIDLPLDTEILGQETEVPLGSVFDNYRSLVDHNVMIFVAMGAVPPFRFKAGGWELLRSAIELGPAMKARLAEKGFFMCRINEDQTAWTELSDLPATNGRPTNEPIGVENFNAD